MIHCSETQLFHVSDSNPEPIIWFKQSILTNLSELTFSNNKRNANNRQRVSSRSGRQTRRERLQNSMRLLLEPSLRRQLVLGNQRRGRIERNIERWRLRQLSSGRRWRRVDVARRRSGSHEHSIVRTTRRTQDHAHFRARRASKLRVLARGLQRRAQYRTLPRCPQDQDYQALGSQELHVSCRRSRKNHYVIRQWK